MWGPRAGGGLGHGGSQGWHLNDGYSWKNPVTWRLGMRRAGSPGEDPGWGQATNILADSLKFCGLGLLGRRCREAGGQEVGLGAPQGPRWRFELLSLKIWGSTEGSYSELHSPWQAETRIQGMVPWSLGSRRSAGFCICWRSMWGALV